MRRNPAVRSVVRVVILEVCVLALVLSAPLAGASAHSLCLLIPTQDTIDRWERAAEETWLEDTFSIRVWEGDWPPKIDELEGGNAFLDDLDGHPTLFVRDAGGEDTILPLDAEGGDTHASRCSILLILRGITSPLGIGDEGWLPPPPPPPEDETTTVLEPPPTAAPPRPNLLSIGIAVGASGRPGLSAPSVAATVSPSLRLAGSGSVDLHLVADVTADLGSRVDLGSVPARLDALLIAGGLEIRPAVRRTTFALRLAGGAHVYWARLPDHDDLPTLSSTRPALRLVGSVGWPLADHVRLGFQVAWTVDLIADETHIRLEMDQGSSLVSADLARWVLAGQAVVEFSVPGTRRAP